MKLKSIKLKFEKKDIWIGVYWNCGYYLSNINTQKTQWIEIYICLIPFFPIKLFFQRMISNEFPSKRIFEWQKMPKGFRWF